MTTRVATCPFCGLLCDDLEVALEGSAIRALRGACARAASAYASLGAPGIADRKPRVRGHETSLDQALDRAVELLRRSRRPFIGGLATDIAGMRATLGLARRVGAVVDHAGSIAKYRNLHVLQEAGWITTTLAEVKNRADTVVLIGTGWHERFPRFVERVLRPQMQLFGDVEARRFVTLNPVSNEAITALGGPDRVIALNTPISALPALLAMLAARAANQPVDRTRAAGLDPARADVVLDALEAARYGVVVWAAADLDLPHAELALHALARLVRALNRNGRFAALPLAGTDGDLTANAVHTWQVGVPYPTSFANGSIDYDPHRYRAARMLEAREPDALLWIASLLDHQPTWAHVPTILLARADASLQSAPEVFIPVATPGIDAAGHLMRTDKVVMMRLERMRTSALPAVAAVIDAIDRRLAEGTC